MHSQTELEQRDAAVRDEHVTGIRQVELRQLRTARRAIDRESDGVRRHGERLGQLNAYRQRLGDDEDRFQARARDHFDNRIFRRVFIALVPLGFMYDWAFSFPSVANSISSVTLTRYFPSLNSWQGQMKLCALLAAGAVLVSVALKLVTETSTNEEDLLNAGANTDAARRWARIIRWKHAFRIVYILTLVGGVTHMWFDAAARSELTARAHGTVAIVNYGLLVVLGGSIALHALLIWFPVALLYRDRLAAQFISAPSRLERETSKSKHRRELAAQGMQRAVADAPKELRDQLVDEIPVEIRREANAALGAMFLSTTAAASLASSTVAQASSPVPAAKSAVIDFAANGARK